MNRFFGSDFFYDFVRAPTAVVSFFIVVLLVTSAIFANFIAPTNPFDPKSLDLMNGFTAPLEQNVFTGQTFLMGTFIY